MRSIAMMLVAATAAGSAFAQCGGWHPGEGVPGIVGRAGTWAYPSVKVIEPWDPDGPGPMRERLVIAGTYGAVADIATTAPVWWDGEHWFELPGLDAAGVKGFATLDGTLYAYGLAGLHRWTGEAWEADPRVIGEVSGAAGFKGKLYASGLFSTPWGTQLGFARLTDEDWEVLLPYINLTKGRLFPEPHRLVVQGWGVWGGDDWLAESGHGGCLIPYGQNGLCYYSEFAGSNFYWTHITSTDSRGTWNMASFGAQGGVRFSGVANDPLHGLLAFVDHSIYQWNVPSRSFGFYQGRFLRTRDDEVWYPDEGYVSAMRSLDQNQTLITGEFDRVPGRKPGTNAAVLDASRGWRAIHHRGLDAPVNISSLGDKIYGIGSRLRATGDQATVMGVRRENGQWLPFPLGSDNASGTMMRSGPGVVAYYLYDNGYKLFVFTEQTGVEGPYCDTFLLRENGSVVAGPLSRFDDANGIQEYVVGDWRPVDPMLGPAAFPAVIGNDVYCIDDHYRLLRLDQPGGTPLAQIRPISGKIRSMDAVGNGLLICGDFTALDDDGKIANRVLHWDGSHLRALGDGLDGTASRAVEFNGEFFVSGTFTRSGDRPISGIARWTGSAWESIGGPSGSNLSMVVLDGTLHVGGNFLSVNGKTSAYYARWSPQGEPILLDTPPDRRVCGRTMSVLEVRADGPGLSYRWYRDGEPLWDGPTPHGSRITGAYGPKLLIERPLAEDDGFYTCEISNACGNLATPPTRLEVCPADLTCDTVTDLNDFISFFGAYDAADPLADLNLDGTIDLADFFAFLHAWDTSC